MSRKEQEIKTKKVFDMLANNESVYLIEDMREIAVKMEIGKDYGKHVGGEEYDLIREDGLYSKVVADALGQLIIITEDQYKDY